MSFNLKRRFFAAAVVACVLSAPALVSANESVLRVVPHADLKVLDPFQTSIYISRYHGYMIFDTLFGMDGSGEIKPQMLQSYTTSPDRLVWTFVLRDELSFSDGAPVTSEDVVASLNRWSKKDLMAQTMFKYVSAVEAIDAKTVRMTLNAPYGLVLETLGKPNSIAPFIVPKRIADGPLDRPMSELIGSGPFLFKQDEYKPGEKVVYVKNPKYVPRKEAASNLSGGKVANYDRVEWIILKDAQTQMNALVTGAVDIVERPASEHIAALKSNPAIQLRGNLSTGVANTLRFNHLIPPFNDVKVRQAAMLALGQEPILRTQVGSRDLYQVCLSVFPCGTPFSSPNNGGWLSALPQLEKAKAALKASSYQGEPIVLLHSTDVASMEKLPLAAAQMWRQAGFKVDLQSMDWATVATRRTNREVASKGGWNAFFTTHSPGDLLNPISHPIVAATGDKAYYGWAKDDRTETLRTEFAMASTVEERKRIAEELQLRVLEQGSFYPAGITMYPLALRKAAVGGLVDGQMPIYWSVTKP